MAIDPNLNHVTDTLLKELATETAGNTENPLEGLANAQTDDEYLCLREKSAYADAYAQQSHPPFIISNQGGVTTDTTTVTTFDTAADFHHETRISQLECEIVTLKAMIEEDRNKWKAVLDKVLDK